MCLLGLPVKATWICPCLAALCPVPCIYSEGAEAMASCHCSLLWHPGVSRNVSLWQRQGNKATWIFFPWKGARQEPQECSSKQMGTCTRETEKDESLDTSAWLQSGGTAEKALHGGMRGELSPSESHLWVQVLEESMGGWSPSREAPCLPEVARCDFALLSCKCPNGGCVVWIWTVVGWAESRTFVV